MPSNTTPTSARLAAVANRPTCRLVHRGRKSGTPYEVTIWFMVEGETVYLATANQRRQWVCNVQAAPAVTLRVGSDTFTGTAERLRDPDQARHVMDLVATKYWYVRPFIRLARLAGFDPTPDASFRVHDVVPA
jgi:deazaflavin-dependent oxidoreductase (nitroreductase family)